MLHVEKAHSLKGLAYISHNTLLKHTSQQTVCCSSQCFVDTWVSYTSKEQLLAVGVQQSTVATLKTGEGVWGGEGCWFVGELWSPLYIKNIHHLSLAQINTTENTESNIHEPVSSQPLGNKKVRIPLTWFSEEIKHIQACHQLVKKTLTDTPTHTFTHARTYLKSGLRKNNKFIQQLNSTDGICCDNIHNTFKTRTTHIDWLKMSSNQLREEWCFLTKKWQLLVFNRLLLWKDQKCNYRRLWWRTVSERKKHWCGFV